MTAKTRQINKQQYNVEQLVDEALVAVAEKTYNERAVMFNLERAGVKTPNEYQIAEMAFLDVMKRATGAQFQNQFGRGLIDIATRERAIETVNGYLNRRVAGQRSNYSQRYGKR